MGDDDEETFSPDGQTEIVTPVGAKMGWQYLPLSSKGTVCLREWRCFPEMIDDDEQY